MRTCREYRAADAFRLLNYLGCWSAVSLLPVCWSLFQIPPLIPLDQSLPLCCSCVASDHYQDFFFFNRAHPKTNKTLTLYLFCSTTNNDTYPISLNNCMDVIFGLSFNILSSCMACSMATIFSSLELCFCVKKVWSRMISAVYRKYVIRWGQLVWLIIKFHRNQVVISVSWLPIWPCLVVLSSNNETAWEKDGENCYYKHRMLILHPTWQSKRLCSMIFDYTKFQVPLYWFHLFTDVPLNLCHKEREFQKVSKPAARRAAPAFFNGVLKQLLTLGWQVDTQDELVLGSCLHPSSPSPHHPLVDCCWQAAHTAVQAADENLYKLPLLHSTSDEGIRKIQTNTKKKWALITPSSVICSDFHLGRKKRRGTTDGGLASW